MTSNTPKFSGRRWHDMGGDAAGPIPQDDHDFSLWEKRIDALLVLCNVKGVFSVDGLRRVLEDMGEEAYEDMTYYERWTASVNQNLIETGVYTTEELGVRMSRIKERGQTYGQASRAD